MRNSEESSLIYIFLFNCHVNIADIKTCSIISSIDTYLCVWIDLYHINTKPLALQEVGREIWIPRERILLIIRRNTKYNSKTFANSSVYNKRITNWGPIIISNPALWISLNLYRVQAVEKIILNVICLTWSSTLTASVRTNEGKVPIWSYRPSHAILAGSPLNLESQPILTKYNILGNAQIKS